MNQEFKLYRISQLMSRFSEQVKILNANGEFSINIHSENILIKVLNNIYNCNLENVNYSENKIYPSIDLRDKSGRIAFQITSTANIDKVKNTLNKFIENDLYKEFDRIYIFIITTKQARYDELKIKNLIDGRFNFDKSNILDKTDLYNELNKNNNLDQINLIAELLEKQFADNKQELDKWNIFIKGLNEYDKYISNYFNYLDIKGFSPKINNTLVKINLENIYVPLKLKLEIDTQPHIGDFPKENKPLVYPLEKALMDFQKIVILGDPGSGKSTILKHLAYKICKDRPTQIEFGETVPIYVKGSEFAKFVALTSKNLSEYIIDYFDKKYELLFSQKLESNELLVLVDGIDEINDTALRHLVVNRINGFIAQYPDIKIIVSSRIVGYKETRLNGHFNHLEVMQFKEKQIKVFITNWYCSISNNSDGDEDLAIQKAEELFNSIKKNNSVLTMASNPLLVTIIALIHYQGGTLPERRASLYDVATSTFLENWVRQRDSHRNPSFDKETLIAILAPISYHIHENFTTGLISESELKKLFQDEYKKIFPYQKAKEEMQDIKQLMDFLREDAGFLFEKGLNENGEPMFGFIHQTFQEYFTAIEFKTLWKENNQSKIIDKYIFNPNWSEVIKLTASLFKYTEQGRLSRQNTTSFIKDILNVEDLLPEMYRPLKFVMDILRDDTEIDFAFFVELMDSIFDEIFKNIHVEYNYRYNSEVSTFAYFLQKLISTKTYQSYIVDRITSELAQTKIPSELLVEILMNSSSNQIVENELIKILSSNNVELKKKLFNYPVVMPVADIVFNPLFRKEIVEYVNSEDFISTYDGRLPTQYHCAFETVKKGSSLEEYITSKSLSTKLNEIKEERMLSIREIKNENIKLDFIYSHVFSIGISDLSILSDFSDSLKKEYPGIELPRIEKYIHELQKFESYNLEKYEIINFKNVKLYAEKNIGKYAIINKQDVTFVEYPFQYADLEPFFKDKTSEYLNFLNLILPAVDRGLQVLVESLDDLKLLIKYNHTIHWSSTIEYDYSINFGLKNLFELSKSDMKKVFKWILYRSEGRYRKVEIDNDLDISNFIKSVKLSAFDLHEKLFLINLVGERKDYEDLIVPTIESFKNTTSIKKKSKIKDILYDIL